MVLESTQADIDKTQLPSISCWTLEAKKQGVSSERNDRVQRE